MIAHHTLGGCNLRPGDLLGSGTISGGAPGTRGCLLEATSGGKEPLFLAPAEAHSHTNIHPQLASSSTMSIPEAALKRVWLEDGDEVVLSGWCQPKGGQGGEAISFGECRGLVLPSHRSSVKM